MSLCGSKRSSLALLTLSLIAAGALAAACSASLASPGTSKAKSSDGGPSETDEPEPVTPSADSGLGELLIRPSRLYSGFDGTHTFTVPVAVYDSAADLTLTADDPSAVDIVPKQLANPIRQDGTTDNGKYFFVTAKKAGTIKLAAKSGGKTAEAQLTVTSYRADRWQVGETRYKNASGSEPACANCHVNGNAIDNSPAALATATDESIAIVITTGISTAGFPIRIDGKLGHRWTVDESVSAGLVTYLRSLEPRGYK
jgi:hypothetical protein